MIGLTQDLWFPDVTKAEEDGLLAVGGDLSPQRLLLAYRSGIFPWFMHAGIIFWFSPPERMVLFPESLHISRSMKRLMRSNRFQVTTNCAFDRVIQMCAEVHTRNHLETWISEEFIKAYCELHRMGIAHSTEVWEKEMLVGGIYGLSIGKIFCGESMFSLAPNASKMALIQLSTNGGYRLIDCQVETNHLLSMGAQNISRQDYLMLLQQHINESGATST
jgi:leucyl/phenylalanyl-tRNA--protein transferase